MHLFQRRFGKAHDLQSESGGRRTDPSPPAAADSPVAAGGETLPLDHPSFPRGVEVTLVCKNGARVRGFRDVGFDDWRDAAGNPLDPTIVPVSWSKE